MRFIFFNITMVFLISFCASNNFIFKNSHSHISHVNDPLQLNIIKSYSEGMAVAKQSNKPIFLLFTSNSCTNNAKIQDLIKSNKELKQFLTEDFINIWLYVDDTTKLPKSEVVERNGQQVTLKTYGNKWADLERTKYDSNIQPLAVIIDSNELVLKSPKSYDELKESLHEFVKDGYMTFLENK